MEIEDNVIRKFISNDGLKFDTEKACFQHEMNIAYQRIGSSSQYVLGIIRYDGSGYFRKYRAGKSRCTGRTSSLKYAYKFSSFEEAFKRGGNDVLTIEAAQKANDIGSILRKNAEEREQRYVKVFTDEHLPGKDGEYITDKGMLSFKGGGFFKDSRFSIMEAPEFWMSKINKTSR